MPPKNAKKRTNRKPLRKSYRRPKASLRNSANSISTTRVRGDLACADRTFVSMRTALLQAGIGLGTTYANYQVRMNSIGVPGVTSTLFQPYGSDQWNAFYYQYIVTRCRAKVTVYNSTAVPAVVVLAPTNTTASFGSDTNTAMGHAGSKTMYLSASGTDNCVRTKYISLNLPSIMGKSRDKYLSDENCAALFPASPANVQYLNVHMSTLDVTTAFTGRLSIELIYDVVWFDRKVLPPSEV